MNKDAPMHEERWRPKLDAFVEALGMLHADKRDPEVKIERPAIQTPVPASNYVHFEASNDLTITITYRGYFKPKLVEPSPELEKQ